MTFSFRAKPRNWTVQHLLGCNSRILSPITLRCAIPPRSTSPPPQERANDFGPTSRNTMGVSCVISKTGIMGRSSLRSRAWLNVHGDAGGPQREGRVQGQSTRANVNLLIAKQAGDVKKLRRLHKFNEDIKEEVLHGCAFEA